MLEEAGVPARIITECQWFGTIVDLRRRYEHALRNHWPDVVVLQFGAIECQPNVVPTWFARNVQSWDRSSHPVAVWYHANVSQRLFKQLRKLQRYASERDWPSYRLSPTRYERELRRVIQLVREETGALVLVLDLDPFGPRIRHWLPGSELRRARYQEVKRRVTDSFDDNVRLVHHALPGDDDVLHRLLPDGLHRNAQGHRLTAEAICREIVAWLEQP